MSIKAYKGFNKDMTCMGFQFEEGKEYSEDKAELCKSGFHACERPLDVFAYYAPAESVYHEVELDDVDAKRSGVDSNVCAKKIKVCAALSIKNLVEAHVEYIKKHVESEKNASEDGNCSAATNTGDYSAATNTGNCSAATNTGYCSAATNTGNYSAATNTGDCSAATNTGNCSAATNTGNCSAATNTGDCSAAEVDGKDSIAIAFGAKSKARGALGCWIVASEWDTNNMRTLIGVKAGKIDGVTLKPDVWYKLENGEFVEAEDE